jgi:hypothetical protein
MAFPVPTCSHLSDTKEAGKSQVCYGRIPLSLGQCRECGISDLFFQSLPAGLLCTVVPIIEQTDSQHAECFESKD